MPSLNPCWISSSSNSTFCLFLLQHVLSPVMSSSTALLLSMCPTPLLVLTLIVILATVVLGNLLFSVHQIMYVGQSVNNSIARFSSIIDSFLTQMLCRWIFSYFQILSQKLNFYFMSYGNRTSLNVTCILITTTEALRFGLYCVTQVSVSM